MCVSQNIPTTERSDIISHYWNITNFVNCSENIEFFQCLRWELDTSNLYHPVITAISDSSNLTWPNFSDYNFPSEIWIRKPDWVIALTMLAFLPFMIVGVFGNALIIYAVVTRCVLQTSTNLLLANLAAADMTILLICPPLFICTASFQNYILGKPGCKMEGFINCCLLVTAVLNVIAISYDRLTVVVLPPEARLNRTGTYIIMIGTWAVGTLFSVPFIIYRVYKERLWLNFLERYCTENKTVLPHYWNVIIVLLVWLPLTVMVVCYSSIIIKLHRYERKVSSHGNLRPVKWKIKVVRTTFIVLVVFILFRVPYTSLIFWRAELLQSSQRNQIIDDNFMVLWFISRYLIFINAAINPFIYGFSNENFKRALRRMEVSRWLFKGTSGTSDVTPASQKKKKQLVQVQHEIYLPSPKEQPVLQQWMSHPLEGKPKTESTECYM